MTSPFRINGLCKEWDEVVVVELTDGVYVGRGEGVPVHYLKESAQSLYRQIDAVAQRIEDGIDREELLKWMPPGGARNAIDSALWDFEAKRTGKSIWELVGIRPKKLNTAFTIGIEDTPETMAIRAKDASMYPILKIKVDKDRPVERVAAIRQARPDARLTVDANQAWTFEQLKDVTPGLLELDVKLIEQPLPREADQPLEEYRSLIPLCADESCQHRSELDAAAKRYQIINIKLDKTGGLTEALSLARDVRDKRLGLLASCMGGTSLSMAPAFVLAQLCQIVELDGPLLLRRDRIPGLRCHRGLIGVPDSRLWG